MAEENRAKGARPLLVEQPIVIKTYDIDFAGIVHNMVYIRWLEDLRTVLVADTYPIERMLAEGISPILAKTEIKYLQPLRFGDLVSGRIWIKDLGRTRWVVQAEIGIGSEVHAAAIQHGYFASLETLRPVRIPAVLQEKWAEAHSVFESGS